MSDDHFNYDQLMLNAHRELIRQVLLQVVQSGLPGDHHFFIIFSTTHHGTRISDRLKAQYPTEMTIVLQHQYSNLKVLDKHFEIQLSFNRIPELLVIPFEAITGFVDPSVPFGLQLAGEAAAGLENSIGMLVPGLPQMPNEEESPAWPETRDADKPHPDEHLLDDFEEEKEAVVELWEGDDTSVPSIIPSTGRLRNKSDDKTDKTPGSETSQRPAEAEDDWSDSANIVQLDAFRKKSK